MTNSSQCRAMNPASCRFHGMYVKLEQLSDQLRLQNNKQAFNTQLDEYFSLRTKIERYEAMGGEQFFLNQQKFMRTNASSLDGTLKQIVTACDRNVLHELSAEYYLYNKYSTLKGITVEMILVSALKKANMAYTHDASSHSPGSDIFLPHKGRKDTAHTYGVSVKSGVIERNGLLKVTGSRTTKKKTLQEKLDHLHDTSPEAYFLLSNHRNDIEKYRMTAFPGPLITYGTVQDWEENEKAWKLLRPVGMLQNASINKSSSDQLTMVLDTSHKDFRGVTGEFKLVRTDNM